MKKKHDKTVFLLRSKLNNIKFLILKALIDSVNSYQLKELKEMKEEFKNLKA